MQFSGPSWPDALAMIQQRHPTIVDIVVGALENNTEFVSIRCLLDCVRKFAETGFEVLDWTDLVEGKVPGDKGEDDPCQPKIGWQKRAAKLIEEHFFTNTVWPSFVSRSCASPLTAPGSSIRSRSVFCSCRIRQPFFLCFRNCRCGRPLSTLLAHHRAVCANAGGLGAQGGGGSRVSGGKSMS